MKMFLALALVFSAACGNSSSSPKDAAVQDAGTSGGGPDASCFTNPTTHYEIINACTTAQKVYKDSHPPLEHADGTLPALPQ